MISGGITLDVNGPRVTELTGTNTYTGTTTISGVLTLGAGGTTGSIAASSPVSVLDNGVLAIDRSDTFTLANAISGSGRLD